MIRWSWLAGGRRRCRGRRGAGDREVGGRQRVQERVGDGDDPIPGGPHLGELRGRGRRAVRDARRGPVRSTGPGRGSPRPGARARPGGRPSTRSSSSAPGAGIASSRQPAQPALEFGAGEPELIDARVGHGAESSGRTERRFGRTIGAPTHGDQPCPRPMRCHPTSAGWWTRSRPRSARSPAGASSTIEGEGRDHDAQRPGRGRRPRRSSLEIGEDPDRQGLAGHARARPPDVHRADGRLPRRPRAAHQRRRLRRRLQRDGRRPRHPVLLAVRAPPAAVLRDGVRRVHPARPGRRALEDPAHRRDVLAPAAGPGAPDPADRPVPAGPARSAGRRRRHGGDPPVRGDARRPQAGHDHDDVRRAGAVPDPRPHARRVLRPPRAAAARGARPAAGQSPAVSRTTIRPAPPVISIENRSWVLAASDRSRAPSRRSTAPSFWRSNAMPPAPPSMRNWHRRRRPAARRGSGRRRR